MIKTYRGKSKELEIRPFERKYKFRDREFTYTAMLVCDNEFTFYGVTPC